MFIYKCKYIVQKIIIPHYAHNYPFLSNEYMPFNSHFFVVLATQVRQEICTSLEIQPLFVNSPEYQVAYNYHHYIITTGETMSSCK